MHKEFFFNRQGLTIGALRRDRLGSSIRARPAPFADVAFLPRMAPRNVALRLRV
jgi:hypothetical protein